ncbi:hypothetical protein Tco_0290774 [Tanacetum coccineum]
MAAFKVLETQFQMFIKSRMYMDDEYVVMTHNYFLQYTQLEIPEFCDTLIQHMESVKKSIDERALHKRDLVNTESIGTESKEQDTSSRLGNDAHADDADIRPIYDEEPMAEALFLSTKKVNEKVYAAQVRCEQCKGPHYTKDYPLKEEGKTLEVAHYTQFGAPFQSGQYRATASRFYQRNNANPSYKEQRQSMEESLSKFLERPFLSTAHAKIDVFKRKITLRVGDEKIIFKSVKPASSLIKRVYMLSLRERMELDLEARLMGETLVLNRSLNPLYGDYIELNDLNVPLELRRDQVDDLMPTIEEGEWWKIWMATEIKTWEIFFLENHSAKLHVWKQKAKWNLAYVPKAQEFLQGGLELSTRICPRCEDGRMAHTRAHKRA